MKTVDQYHRRSIRLKEYDYSSPEEYFVKICTYSHEFTLGEIVDGVMRLNEKGKIVEEWLRTAIIRLNIQLDSYIIMPNHIHGIIRINDIDVGAGSEPAPTGKRHGLTEIIRQLKTYSSLRINKIRNTIGNPMWQRNYYDSVIRSDKELNNIREYISNNVLQWAFENDNPDDFPLL